MMKLDVFESVATVDAADAGAAVDPTYRYELLPHHALPILQPKPAREFISRVFDDVLEAVENDANYEGKYTFDKNVFQKFISLMFVNYATTDPMFYGTNKADYGVSGDKEMQDTPLYRAVAVALRELEAQHPIQPTAPAGAARRAPHEIGLPGATPAAPLTPTAPGAPGLTPIPAGEPLAPVFTGATPPAAPATYETPAWAHAEQTLMEPFMSIAEAMQLLRRLDHPRARECGEIISLNARRLFRQLKTLGLISPVVADPLDHVDELHSEGD